MTPLILTYPTPDDNPACHCKGNPLAAMFCDRGHMLECHHPYNCTGAGCSHLGRYDLPAGDFRRHQGQAREKIRNGQLRPYRFDEHGQVVVDLTLLHSGERLDEEHVSTGGAESEL